MNYFEIGLILFVYIDMIWRLVKNIRQKEWGAMKYQILMLALVSVLVAGIYII